MIELFLSSWKRREIFDLTCVTLSLSKSVFLKNNLQLLIGRGLWLAVYQWFVKHCFCLHVLLLSLANIISNYSSNTNLFSQLQIFPSVELNRMLPPIHSITLQGQLFRRYQPHFTKKQKWIDMSKLMTEQVQLYNFLGFLDWVQIIYYNIQLLISCHSRLWWKLCYTVIVLHQKLENFGLSLFLYVKLSRTSKWVLYFLWTKMML